MTPTPHTEAVAVELQIRIGELGVAANASERLVTVGLGSCIGVAIIDVDSGVAGLAHVFLPSPPPTGVKPGAGEGTYAETAVPTLVERVTAAATRGPRRSGRANSLVAVIAGGARMFATRPGTADVGERNITAVEAALRAAGIKIVATDVGGSHGRTMRVNAGTGTSSVTVRQVGSDERELWTGNSEARVARAA